MAMTTRTAPRARATQAQNGSTAEVCLAILLVFALVAIAAGSGSRATAPSVTRTVFVSSGETLWALAAANPVEGLSTEQTVELIVEMNALDGSDVTVGQKVTLPAAADTSVLAMR